MHQIELRGAVMISSRSIASSSQSGSRSDSGPGKVESQALHQDPQGPLDGELLDLYVAILIAVPLACLLRFLWS
jgi:hypothetical protein